MLEISAVMNSGVEDIFAFKTCCGVRVFDQNLEILIRNKGPDTVVVPSHCDLRGLGRAFRITNLMPHGDQRILPGEVKAFYCTMDEVTWSDARELVIYDKKGKAYSISIVAP